jgi:hypothetical protein
MAKQHSRFNLMDAWMWSLMSGATSHAPAVYRLGDEVEVTNGAQIGERETVLARGTVEAVGGTYPHQWYWVTGVEMAQDAQTLRLVQRGGVR